MYVAAEIRWHPTSDPNASEFASRLAGLVQARLAEAGLSVAEQTPEQLGAEAGSVMRKVIGGRLGVDPNTLRFRTADMPILQVAVDLMSSEAQASLAMYARTSFSRQVSLSGRTLVATVWSADPAVKSVRPARWREEIQKVVTDQVEAFIAARKTAAAQDGQVLLRSQISALPRPAADTLSHPFLASKNSTVFHRADCRLAQTIAQDNLVGYNSREEAVAGGKRPCKTCNP
jgi:hypothetical protein